jgi:transposase-like protein
VRLSGLDKQADATARSRAATRTCGSTPKVEKVRDSGWVVRKALVLAYAVHESGDREVIGLDLGEAETEAFWRSFLRSLVERRFSGVQLVVSDVHAGLEKAITQVLGCSWQRCSVHFLREALGHARREQQPMLAALLRPLFNADIAEKARELVGDALERLRKPLPKVVAQLEEAEDDLLAFQTKKNGARRTTSTTLRGLRASRAFSPQGTLPSAEVQGYDLYSSLELDGRRLRLRRGARTKLALG